MERYSKIRTIGKGSYGYAVLVREKQTGELRVMKVIDVAKLDRQQKEDALNEIHVLRALKHPYIVTYVESFLEKRCLCIIMEYAEGGDLYSWLGRLKARHERASEKQVIEWFLQLCLALKYVHDHKVLHRDLKSQNVFLTAKGEIKLGDFGISRVLQSTYDCANTVIGTPYYLSPEICQEKPYNQKSDVWSLGCLLYEMMALKHAFSAKTLKSLVVKIIQGVYDPLPQGYSPQLYSLVAELLAKEPSSRPSLKRILSKDFLRTQIPLLIGPKSSFLSNISTGSEQSCCTDSSEDRKISLDAPIQPNEGDQPPEMMENTGTLQGDAVLSIGKNELIRQISEFIPEITGNDSLSYVFEALKFHLIAEMGVEMLQKASLAQEMSPKVALFLHLEVLAYSNSL